MTIPLCIGLIIGMLIGRFLRPDGRGCPQRIMGYPCRGQWCDHSDSLYYEARMHQAINRERINRDGGGNA